jgi:hypothetical protein
MSLYVLNLLDQVDPHCCILNCHLYPYCIRISYGNTQHVAFKSSLSVQCFRDFYQECINLVSALSRLHGNKAHQFQCQMQYQ